MSNNEDAILYEQFIDAREAAIAVTDCFASVPPNHPDRDKLWDAVMRQTEAARVLLERWLQQGRLSEQSSACTRERGTRRILIAR